MSRGTNEARERVLLGIACVVTVVWSCSVMVQVVFPTHAVPLEVHAIMASVAASFFGGSYLAGKRSERTNGGES